MHVVAAQPEPLAFSQQEAAKVLMVTDRTLRNWERDGTLVPARVGGVVLYPRTLLVRFLEQLTPPQLPKATED